LEYKIQQNTEEISKMKEEREILRKNREDFIQAKNEELAKLEQATNDLSTRFNAMLQETLYKMK
jgi:hypothetical protein